MAVTERARQAIGENAKGDFRLDLGQHASCLPAEAASLTRILQQDEMRKFAASYEFFDKAAARSQTQYKVLAGLGVWSVGGALIVATWALAFPWQHWEGEARQVAIAVVYAAMVLGFVALSLLDRKSPYRAWRQHRANAEVVRGKLFEEVLRAPDPGQGAAAGELPLLPLKVQYVRRFHLDVQCAFYAARSLQARKAGRRSRHMRVVAFWLMAIGFAATLIALAIPIEEPRVAWPIFRGISRRLEWIDVDYIDHFVLLAGVTMVLLYCLALARAEINRDARNAYRYERVARRLATFREAFRDVEELALDPRNQPAVVGFFGKLQAALDAEHRDWISLHLMDEIEAEGEMPVQDPSQSQVA